VQNKKLVVYESNALVQSYNKLSLSCMRLIFLCLGTIDQRTPIDPNEFYSVDLKVFASTFNIASKTAYHELRKIHIKLLQEVITIPAYLIGRADLSDHETKIDTHVIQACRFNAKKRTVELQWSNAIIPLISNIKRDFTKHSLRDLSTLNSIHSFKIYRIISQYRKIPSISFTVEKFRLLLGLEDKYPIFSDLKKHVLMVAVKEIEQNTNYKIKVLYEKKDRKVHTLKFQIKEVEGM